MAIESASYIDGLEPLNPAATDLLKQGDDHLRLIKSVLKNTFPNITGPVTLTQDEINSPASSVPVGSILMWYGASNDVPDGFALCNGQTVNKYDGSGTITTPDMTDRIPMGVKATSGSVPTLGATAGAKTGSGSTSGATANVSGTTSVAGAHTHGGGTLAAAAGSVTFGTRTGDYSVVGSDTGPYVTSITNPHSHTISGATDSQGDHSHTFSGTVSLGAINLTIDTLPPVIGLHFIIKV